MRRNMSQVLPAQAHDAARLCEAHNGAYRRGLAGAVSPDERGGRARRQREADASQHCRIGDSDVDVLEVQHRRHIPITCSRTLGPDRTSPGLPTFWIFPTFHTATRWAYRSTMSMSCSTKTEVTCSLASADVRMSMISSFSAEATPEVGSSISSSLGLSASARAMSTSLRCPSGSSLALRDAYNLTPTRSRRRSISGSSGRAERAVKPEGLPSREAAAISMFSI